MTEPNPDAELDAAAQIAWPELPPAGFAESDTDGTDTDGTQLDGAHSDGTVQAILDRVRDVPGLPVSEHPAAYAEMHDNLLAALNEDISGPAGGSAAAAGPGAA
ncbi:hypothetical protein [Arthrobacter sp. NPDC093139]|uniref:hypothetical protein n=1 Tax=Arthrobacter sp. NPDC093139 TaxID=3363945 RepID=UPI00383084D8